MSKRVQYVFNVFKKASIAQGFDAKAVFHVTKLVKLELGETSSNNFVKKTIQSMNVRY